MDKEKAKGMLIESYSDKNYQVKLHAYKDELYNILSKLIVDVKKNKNDLNIFEDPHARVKSVKSFSEKIVKKNYYVWIDDESENPESIQTKIALRLTDIIGFRFNCYFFNEEESIYNTIKSIFEGYDIKRNKPLQYQNIDLDFSEGTLQKNKRKIYKFSGIYKNEVKFEVQIKSMVKDLWGEVEHFTTYKAERIDSKRSVKEKIQNESLAILEAVDKELEYLYKDLSEPDLLIKELFFQYSHLQIASKNKGIDIVPAYLIFFNLLARLELEMDINSFVGHSLIKSEYSKKKLRIDLNSDKGLLHSIEKYSSEIFSTVLDIFDLLFEFETNRSLIQILANLYYKDVTSNAEYDADNIDSDVFSDVPENSANIPSLNAFLDDLGIKEI